LARWTEGAPPADLEPKGDPECATRAIEYLRPFSDASGTCSEAEVRGRVEELARTFNYHLLAERGAPRVSDVVEQLETAQRMAIEFEKYLRSLDDFSVYILRTAAMDQPGFSKFLGTNDHNDPFQTRGNVNKLGASLREFANHTEITLAIFENRFRPDVGGNTNLYKKMIGNARMNFVQQGLLLFERFKPGKATGYADGKLHLFLMEVFEYATGQEPETNSKLLSVLKVFAKAFRSRRKAEAHYEKLFDEREMLRRQPNPDAKRLKDLDTQCEEAMSLMGRHWMDFIPQLQH
jgi:hypothetical protein